MAALVSYWDADVARCAVDNEVGEREAPFVVEQLPDVLLEDVVPDAGEVVVDVRFQYPSVCAAVPAVILPHEVAQPVEAEVGSLAYLRAVVVENERPGEDVVENGVAKGVLDDFVLEGVGLNEPFLRLEDIKLPVAAGAVCAGAQLLLQDGDSLEGVHLHLGDSVLPPLAAPGCPVGVVERFKFVDGIKIDLRFLHLLGLLRTPQKPRGPRGLRGVGAMCLSSAVCLWTGYSFL